MPRRHRPERRVLPPDAKDGHRPPPRFVTKIMLDGKKSIAERIVYDAIEQLEQRERRSGVEVFEQAMRNVTPILEVKPRRVGGATYQVPIEIRPERRIALAMRWLIR